MFENGVRIFVLILGENVVFIELMIGKNLVEIEGDGELILILIIMFLGLYLIVCFWLLMM